MESTRSIEEISSDLERYSRISEYFKEHPERKKANKSYLGDIAVELLGLSEKELPRELEVSCAELFDFFYNSYDFRD